MSLQGIYGHPRRLVTDTTRRLCDAIKANNPSQPVKFVLMNTAGNRNRNLSEQVSFAERVVVGLIRLLLPPHAVHQQAALQVTGTHGLESLKMAVDATRRVNLAL
jgi:hypothetical protein